MVAMQAAAVSRVHKLQRRGLGSSRYGSIGYVHDDVVALQTRVGVQMVALAVVVEGCGSKIDPATMAAWDDVARRALAYDSADPDGGGGYDAMMAQGGAMLTELNSWGPRLTALGCSNAPPPAPVPATPSAPSTPENQIATALKWVAGAVIVGSVTWMVSPAVRAWARRVAA
jgi:hypothetical protein